MVDIFPPDDLFESFVVGLPILIGAIVGYHRGGILWVLLVHESAYFGVKLQWATYPRWDVAPPGFGIALFLSLIGVVMYGLPSYITGRLLRFLVETGRTHA